MKNRLTQNFGEPKSRARHARESKAKTGAIMGGYGRQSLSVISKVKEQIPEIQEVAMAVGGLNANLLNRLSKLPMDEIALAIEAIKNGGHPRDVINYYISQNLDVSLEEQKKRKINISAHDPQDAVKTIAVAWLKGKITHEYFIEFVAELQSIVDELRRLAA